MFDTKSICDVIGKSEHAVRNFASALPMQSVAVERQPRLFTTRDAVALLVADALVRKNLPQKVALAIVADVASLLERIVLEEGSFQPWVCVWPAEVGFDHRIVESADSALRVVKARKFCTAVDIAQLVSVAMARLLEAKRCTKAAAHA
ncbi:hypothetical protein [Aureimonas pseudogalii]|uniref:Argininosuccinate lyase n=1 Tax=Aureimonas pseudogalii TaxID=1744844 RepID=A0A7W6MJU4_9HYPH|nr:hypothetical protein [Aureimonas pseudogalii]MBB3998622.1 argininosuccinate lyase [Aureimonas pseudogalii]